MSIATAKMVSKCSRLPAGARIVAWIDHHPNGRMWLGTTVITFGGIETTWDGCGITSIRQDWRNHTEYELSEGRRQ